jgi:hypothetical protein
MMARARKDGLCLLLLGGSAFLLLGFLAARPPAFTRIDFKIVYYSASCLMRSCDPYQQASLRQVYRSEAGESPADAESLGRVEYHYVYLPTAFVVTIPFALMPFGYAHILWLTVISSTFMVAAFLIWKVGAEYAPVACGALILLLLANSEILLFVGNPGGIAVSLCIIAVWCFLESRFEAIGVLCLTVSLVLKPHDAGLVWAYFLLAGPKHRRRALQTLAVTIAVSIPAVLWVTHVSPHWPLELNYNMEFLSGHGGENDPGPATTGARGFGMMVNLQTAISVFLNNPRVYNLVAYMIGGILVLIWALKVFKAHSQICAWLALGAASALSMLPVYHRQSDLKLLMLTVPSCATLWATGRLAARLFVLANAIGIVLTGDLFWIVFDHFLSGWMRGSPPGWSLTFILAIMVPLVLLVLGSGFLFILLKRMPVPDVRSRNQSISVEPIPVQ